MRFAGHRRVGTMKPSTFFLVMVAVLSLVLGGCATIDTSLQVSGTPGAQFTAQYRVGGLSGSVTTVTATGRAATVLELPGRKLTFEVSKLDPATQVSVEIRQAGRIVCHAEAPVGTKGVRVWHTAIGWQQKTL